MSLMEEAQRVVEILNSVDGTCIYKFGSVFEKVNYCYTEKPVIRTYDKNGNYITEMKYENFISGLFRRRE